MHIFHNNLANYLALSPLSLCFCRNKKFILGVTPWMSQPHFGLSVRMKLTLPKLGIWSPPTFECLKFDSRGQNTSHWGVLGVIGKVLKCKCPKWPRIGHLDICSPSYGQKKGQESNWQFDFRPLKVRNRPLPNIWF